MRGGIVVVREYAVRNISRARHTGSATFMSLAEGCRATQPVPIPRLKTRTCSIRAVCRVADELPGRPAYDRGKSTRRVATISNGLMGLNRRAQRDVVAARCERAVPMCPL